MDWRTRLKERLEKGYDPLLPDGLRAASVLVPIYEKDGQSLLLFTERSPDLLSHAGQISFPGGAVDPDESYLDAACREAREEIGLDASLGQFLGRLRPVTITISGFFVVPQVFYFQGEPVTGPIETAEVRRVFSASIADLQHLRTDGIHPRTGLAAPWSDYFLPQGRLWGATAMMVGRLLSLLEGP